MPAVIERELIMRVNVVLRHQEGAPWHHALLLIKRRPIDQAEVRGFLRVVDEPHHRAPLLGINVVQTIAHLIQKVVRTGRAGE